MKSIYHPQYVKLIQQLVDARKSISLTQAQLAAILEKPQSYVAKVEGCERKLDVFEFVVWSQALGLRPSVVISTIDTTY